MITKHSTNEGCECFHLGGHHQDVSGFKQRICCEQLQDLIAHHLQLAHPPRAGMKFQ